MTTATTTKVTRPAINKILIAAGFTKALWRNRDTERLWNSGFLISEVKDWSSLTTATTKFYIEHAYVTMNSYNMDEVHAIITDMADALNSNGIVAKIHFNSANKANSISIAKFQGAN